MAPMISDPYGKQQFLVDAICEGVMETLRAGGAPKVHVSIALELDVPDRPGVTDVEFVIVRGFECANRETCGRRFHVEVHGASRRYEYGHEFLMRGVEL